jgi:rRNA processing protein Krr1/Pno1
VGEATVEIIKDRHSVEATKAQDLVEGIKMDLKISAVVDSKTMTISISNFHQFPLVAAAA